MTVKEMMLKLLEDPDGADIDFCDDYDESAYCAYCGNHWSAEAEEKYAIAFGLQCEDYEEGDDCIIVHCENGKEVNALARLLYDMAGYGPADEYDRLFPEPEEEPEPERKPVEVVLRNEQGVIKAKQIDFDVEHGVIEVLGMDDEWYPYRMQNVLRIIGER